MSMPRLTIVFALILVALGVGFWLGTGRQSATALIPAFLGVPMAALGLWAARRSARGVPMHIAVVLAVLGFAGSVSGVPKLVTHLGGGEVARPEAVLAQSLMALVCLVYVILGVRSFVVARRRRGAEDGS
jgi:multisubunit Na+/H+ antiporter MnhF subunit